MHDIVYICKKGIDSEELRYSLRSVCKNFPYNLVWIYGDCPKDISPDRFIPVDQNGSTLWARVAYTLNQIFKNDEISENFWLFNDDFFVMNKVDPGDEPKAWINGSIDHQVKGIMIRNHGPSKYTDQLKKTAATLRSKGYDSLNYAVHVPMLINRKKGLETLKAFPHIPMFRCLYGNMHKIPAILHRDVKLVGTNEKPDPNWLYLSTNDGSFRSGQVGDYIREKFQERCRYEVSL